MVLQENLRGRTAGTFRCVPNLLRVDLDTLFGHSSTLCCCVLVLVVSLGIQFSCFCCCSSGFKIYRLSISWRILKIYFNICDESFEMGFRPLWAKVKILGNFRASVFKLSQFPGVCICLFARSISYVSLLWFWWLWSLEIRWLLGWLVKSSVAICVIPVWCCHVDSYL